MPAKATSGYCKVRKGFCVRKSPQNQPLETTTTTNIAEEPVTPTLNTSASSQKIQPIDTPKSSQLSNNINGYRLVDMEILADLFKLMMCPSCQQCNITLAAAPLKKQGLSTLLTLKSCDFAKENYSSRRVNKNKSFDINLRTVYTMRACGLGYAGIQNFTSLMNMPAPMTANNYDKLVKIITPIVKNVEMDTMSDAVEDLKNKARDNNNDILDTAVSVDGTWQHRGYCSLNGIVTRHFSQKRKGYRY